MPDATGTSGGFMQKWGWLLLTVGGVFVVGYFILGRKNNKNAPTTSTSGVTSANGQPVQYVPTTGDSYTNINYNQNSNSNNTTNIPASPMPPMPPSHGPLPTTKPPSGIGPVPPTPSPTPVPVPILPSPVPPPPPPPPTPKPPTPMPLPPAHPPISATKSYTIVRGDTLSGIASRFHTTWPVLYNMNKGVIDSTSAAHGDPIPGGAYNNIFPGEVIQVPN